MKPEDHQYRRTGRFFALAAGGTEELAAAELSGLGAGEVEPAYRGVHFDATRETLYDINYRSRLVTRVLAPLVTFDCHSDRYLYRTGREIDWSELLSLDDTFAIFATVSNSRITHSQFAARRLKDAIVDQFRDRTGRRPSVRTPDPDLWINLHIHDNRAVISLDTSGGSLHRRGYRKESVQAPMQETLAAAVIRLSEWDADRPLADPMCGSGTLLAEAFMHAARLPAAFGRRDFGFMRMPDFDRATWVAVRDRADAAVRNVPRDLISGSDVDPAAVKAARTNLAALPGGSVVRLSRGAIAAHPGLENGVIVCNPPYGVRLGTDQESSELWRALGDWLKQRCTGSSAFLFAGRAELLKSVGLRSTWKRPLPNGPLDGRLARYDLF